MGYRQLVAPRVRTVDGMGWCLRFTQTVFGAPVAHPSARSAWDAQEGRHVNAWPPRGVAVPIWLDHWGRYGSPARFANWGHAAVSLPDGTVLSSPLLVQQGGQARYKSILAMMRDLGGNPRYLGWSEYMNGLRVVEPVKGAAAKPKPGAPVVVQEEDDEMKPTVHVRLDGGKSGEYMVVHPAIGRDLAAGGKRVEGNVTVFRGYMVSTDAAVGTAWARLYARGSGGETSRTDRAGYIAIQSAATRVSLEVA